MRRFRAPLDRDFVIALGYVADEAKRFVKCCFRCDGYGWLGSERDPCPHCAPLRRALERLEAADQEQRAIDSVPL